MASGAGVANGTIEAWVDGVKIYSASDLPTCGGSPTSEVCGGLGSVDIVAYHNGADTTSWNGQQVIDNLVIATSYIGPPAGGGGSGDTTPPAAPQNLRKR